MLIIPFTTSGRITLEYKPVRMDADRISRDGQEVLAIKRNDWKGRYQADEGVLTQADIDAEEKSLADQEVGLADIVENVRKTHPAPLTFILAMPTGADRDLLAARMTQAGVMQINQDIMRSLMIQELFVQDWGKGSDAANEVHAEELANRIDDFWMKSEIQDSTFAEWAELERQRVLDIAAWEDHLGARAGRLQCDDQRSPPAELEASRCDRGVERLCPDPAILPRPHAHRRDPQSADPGGARARAGERAHPRDVPRRGP